MLNVSEIGVFVHSMTREDRNGLDLSS